MLLITVDCRRVLLSVMYETYSSKGILDLKCNHGNLVILGESWLRCSICVLSHSIFYNMYNVNL